MLSTNLANEITFQYDSVWGKYFRHLVDGGVYGDGRTAKGFQGAEQVEAESQVSLGSRAVGHSISFRA